MKGAAYQSLRNKVRQFEPSTLLKCIAHVSALRIKDPHGLTRLLAKHLTNPHVGLPDFVLAELAKMTLDVETRPYYRRDKIPTYRDLAYLQQLYFDVDAEQNFEDMDDVEQFFFRLSSLQFPSQDGVWQLVPRTLLIHKRPVASRTTKAGTFDTDLRFRQMMGLSLDEYTFLGVSLFALAVAARDGLLHLDHLLSIPLPQYERTKVEAFLHVTSTDFDQFRTECKAKCHPQPGLEIYDYNPLVARPVVRLSGGQYVLPIPRLLIERVTSGVFYDLAATHGNEFLTYLGHSYQRYVGMLFEGIEDIQVLPEMEYGSKKQRRLSPDWVIVHRDDAIVVECKTKRLRLGSRLPHMKDELRADLEKGVATAVTQLSTAVADIRNGAVYPQISSARLFPLVVTLDESYFFNTNTVRSLVSEQLAMAGTSAIDYQVAGTREIEYLSAFQNGARMLDIVSKKYGDPSAHQNDLATLIRDMGGYQKHPLLEKTYKEFLAEMRLGTTLR